MIAPASPAGFKPTSRAQVLGGEMLDRAGAGQWPNLLPQLARGDSRCRRCAEEGMN